MEQRNLPKQSFRARRIAAQDAIEKSEPFFTVAVSFGVGVVMLVRTAWEHDIFAMILFTVVFLVVIPYLPYGVIGEVGAR